MPNLNVYTLFNIGFKFNISLEFIELVEFIKLVCALLNFAINNLQSDLFQIIVLIVENFLFVYSLNFYLLKQLHGAQLRNARLSVHMRFPTVRDAAGLLSLSLHNARLAHRQDIFSIYALVAFEVQRLSNNLPTGECSLPVPDVVVCDSRVLLGVQT